MDPRVKQMLFECKKAVFFGGAGVSTESNIPDFRSESGLYNAMNKYGRSPEEMLSHSFYLGNREMFFDYYKNNLIYLDAEPNKAHKALARLEEEGKLLSVITQNIDGLHQKAGSKRVHELHGSVLRNYCTKCHEFYDVDYIMNPENCDGKNGLVPRCRKCGGVVKPDVVLYEESLDYNVMTEAINDIKEADLLIIGGTSLVVYPAAGFIRHFQSGKMILINKSETQYDSYADLVIHDSIGKVLGD
ncbi:MAG: NAD-dependent protein deacylase [Firmicutes bacterium]|nr:NAD-dependent protein deacylase [Bacillota bacterium]MBQ3122897.1 NAD-dependent protein deacylase [Bacillota bacterium]MBQ9971932.1 NAD-dependent protein deacylase [Bacillota bacterium]